MYAAIKRVKNDFFIGMVSKNVTFFCLKDASNERQIHASRGRREAA
jgi:hypothetical protein